MFRGEILFKFVVFTLAVLRAKIKLSTQNFCVSLHIKIEGMSQSLPLLFIDSKNLTYFNQFIKTRRSS